MSLKKFYIFIFSIVPLFTNAQESTKTLNAEQIIALVRQFHPVVKQANISIEKSRADITIARSAFDLLLNTNIGSKTFDRVNYYNYTTSDIVIPTWYGIEVYSGIENITGNRLDPSQTANQTSYFGISIPLAKDLIMDKRRAFLQQAKLFNSMTTVERKIAINDLLMHTMEAYWMWVKAYQTYKIMDDIVTVNKKRLDLIKKAYLNGERPAIDTVEALTQLQEFQYQKNIYWLEFRNAGLELSSYLWKENNEPYLLPENVMPERSWETEINVNNFNLPLTDWLTIADKNHPALEVYNYKLDILAIDQKLKFQELLPKIDFRYNQLGKNYDFFKTIGAGPLFENNFQYQIKAELPLRLSQGRGEYRKAKLKIQETKLEQNQKKLYIQLKIKSYYNECITLKNQISLYNNLYANYQELVHAEETKFFNGESSLFLINSRENKALESLKKLIELKTKYYKSLYALKWSAGLLQ